MFECQFRIMYDDIMGYLGNFRIYLWEELANYGETCLWFAGWWWSPGRQQCCCLALDSSVKFKISSKCIRLYFKSVRSQQKFAHAMTVMAQCCLVICHVLLWLDWSSLYEVVGGYIGFTPSVRPSRLSCPLCNIYSSGWIFSILATNDHYHERVCHTQWPLTLIYIFKVIGPWLRKSCPLCSIYSSGWILFIFGTNDHYH